MSLSPIAFIAPNYRDFKNDWLKAYEPGTTTPKTMALDSAGATTVAKLQLNADGFLESSGGALVIPYIDGSYDAWLFPTEAEADANDTSNAERLADDITGVSPASINNNLINDLSQAYEFGSFDLMLLSETIFPTDKILPTGVTRWKVQTAASETQLASGQYVSPINEIHLIDFTANGGADDTAQLIVAMSKGDVIIGGDVTYNFVGEAAIPSNTTITVLSNVVWDLNGENGRGFYFGEGVENSYVVGNGYITGNATTLGSDGSRNGIISFGSDFYVTTDPVVTRNCGVIGKLRLKSIGTANVKLIQGYGYVEDIDIEVDEGTGQSNFPIAFHWVGDGTASTIATKTWHPHKIRVKNSHVFDDGVGDCLRAFTFSGCGRVDIDDCIAGCVTLNYNFFIGDYGYTYAQNINNESAYDFHFSKLKSESTGLPLSCDAVSSGLFGSPIWVGSDYNASVVGRDFSVIDEPLLNGIIIAPTGLDRLVIHDLNIKETNLSQTREWINAVGCNYIELDGDAVTVRNSRFRSSDKVIYDVNSDKTTYTPDASSVTLQLESSSGACTLSVAAVAGDESITVIDSDIQVFSGGIIKWGSQKAKLTSSLLIQAGAQVVGVEPLHVNIAISTPLTVGSIVAMFDAGPVELKGSRTTVALLGDSTARPENVTFNGTDFGKSGLNYINADACEGLTLSSCTFEDGGTTSTTVNTYGVDIKEDCVDFAITAPRFGKRNKSLRYLIRVDNASENGVITGGRYESINDAATNSAAISLNTATNVVVGVDNIVSNGVLLKYPI